jgi:hypothetical protein
MRINLMTTSRIAVTAAQMARVRGASPTAASACPSVGLVRAQRGGDALWGSTSRTPPVTRKPRDVAKTVTGDPECVSRGAAAPAPAAQIAGVVPPATACRRRSSPATLPLTDRASAKSRRRVSPNDARRFVISSGPV